MNQSRTVSLRTAIAMAAGAVAVFFCGIYAAHALTPGNPGVSPRTAFTVSGRLTGVGSSGLPGLVFTFHKMGVTTPCTIAPGPLYEQYDPATNLYSAQLDYSTGTGCSPGFFDGTDITTDIAVGTAMPFITNAYINPVPYAQFAASAGSAADGGPLASALVPPGTIVAYGGAVPPNGWLACDGIAYPEATYMNLYMAINTDWGSPAPGMFNVPDLRGRFLRGVDRGTSRDPNCNTRASDMPGGAGAGCNNVGTIEGNATAMPNAIPFGTALAGGHTPTQVAHSHGAGAGGAFETNMGPCVGMFAAGTYCFGAQSTTDSQAPSINPVPPHSHTVTGGDSETRPINAAVNYIIKY